MTQRVKLSAIESLTNTFVGFLISVLITRYVIPFFSLGHPSYFVSFKITLVYTTISLARNFTIRRIFTLFFD